MEGAAADNGAAAVPVTESVREWLTTATGPERIITLARASGILADTADLQDQEGADMAAELRRSAEVCRQVGLSMADQIKREDLEP